MIKSFHSQAEYFKILMHPTRLAILAVLREGEQCVCHMEAMLDLRQAHISQHLMVLREAGLVSDHRDGWNIFYRIDQPEIFSVIDAMGRLSGASETLDFAPSLFESRKISCPCPKCNPGKDEYRCDSVQADQFVQPVLKSVDSPSDH